MYTLREHGGRRIRLYLILCGAPPSIRLIPSPDPMALRKTPKADLKRKYPVYLQIGLLLSLGLVIAAFAIPFDTGGSAEMIQEEQEIIEIEQIEQTQQIQPPPPPPPAPPPPEEVPDDEVIEEDIIESIDMDMNDAPPAPPAPPPPPPSNDEPPPPEPEPEPQEPEIFEVVEQDPELIGGIEGLQSRVQYPDMARRAGTQGTVFLRFVVDEQGRVSQIEALRSPSPQLTEAAVEALRASEFRPGMQRGRPVKVRFSLPVRFVLN